MLPLKVLLQRRGPGLWSLISWCLQFNLCSNMSTHCDKSEGIANLFLSKYTKYKQVPPLIFDVVDTGRWFNFNTATLLLYKNKTRIQPITTNWVESHITKRQIKDEAQPLDDQMIAATTCNQSLNALILCLRRPHKDIPLHHTEPIVGKEETPWSCSVWASSTVTV